MQFSLPVAAIATRHTHLLDESSAVMTNLSEVLSQFDTHKLDSPAENLMSDRRDAKYLLPMAVLPRFLKGLSPQFSLLEHGGSRCFTYENTYFDTPELTCYQQHHNGQLGRLKVRYRRYRESDTAFFDLKFKNNKRRTIKERLEWGHAQSDVCVDSDNFPTGLKSALWHQSLDGAYRRLSLWNADSEDRLTVDFDLCFQTPDENNRTHLPEFFVAELKRRGKLSGSDFFQRAKTYTYLPTDFSKYCVGILITRPHSHKYNNFKPLLRRLQQFGCNNSYGAVAI